MLDDGCSFPMPDPLDPFDAIVSGFTDPLKRILAYMGVTGGAFVLGGNIHEAPVLISSIAVRGPRALMDLFDLIKAASPVNWMGMMLNSLAIWYLLPLAVAYLVMFVMLWNGADMFKTLFALALIHPVQTYVYVEQANPSAMANRIISIILLIVCEISIAGLLLWWRQIQVDAEQHLSIE
jgi:hypothetical protein